MLGCLAETQSYEQLHRESTTGNDSPIFIEKPSVGIRHSLPTSELEWVTERVTRRTVTRPFWEVEMGRRELSDTACRNAKPRAAVYYLADAKGLRLCVRPNGSKLWMLRFTAQKPDGTRKESTAGLGTYPEVSLEQARKKAASARQSAADGIHPTTARRVAIARNVEAGAATFEAVAKEWLAHNRARLVRASLRAQ